MFNEEINTLLQKSLKALPTLVCTRDLSRDIDDLVALVIPKGKLAVIHDEATGEAMGRHVFNALKGRFDCQQVILEGVPVADMETAELIRNASTSADALVAVGSGTINDLCKHAAHLDGKPYIVFPTAASMNGYLSANASLAVNGYKATLPAQMPVGLFCDLSVIAKAPLRLNQSGLGDCLARPAAQWDWLMSHLLLKTPYNEVPYKLLASVEPHLFERARGIMLADPGTLEVLMEALLLSGLGMTIAGGNHPASQGEHMIAHAMHMLRGLTLPETYHGEEIAVTTLNTVQLQEKMMFSILDLKVPAINQAAITALFGDSVADEAHKSYKIKLANVQRANLKPEHWDRIAKHLEKVMVPSNKLQSVLEAAGAPITPAALGWSQLTYDTARNNARFLRDRFTVLDLVA